MLRPFELHRAATVSEAVQLRRQYGDEAALYAGGTELLLAMKLGLAHWPHLIDVKAIPELRGVEIRNGCLRIGAAVTHHQLERSQVVRTTFPEFARLESQVANIRVRVAGTLGGNLAFGEPHADPPTLLIAIMATVRLAGVAGERAVSLEDFLVGAYTTALQPDELVTAIEVPLPAAGHRCAYANFRIQERPSIGIAIAGLLDGGLFMEAPDIVVGAVNDVPQRVRLSEIARTEVSSPESIRVVQEAARSAAQPVSDAAGSAEYKKHLVGVLAARTLAALTPSG